MKLVGLSCIIPILIAGVGCIRFQSTPECTCGYGGPCVVGSYFEILIHTAKDGYCGYYCRFISGSYYSDCSTILNYCENVECLNDGICVPTFGAFFCKCTDEFFGQTCEYRRSQFKDVGEYPKNEFYVYTQIQTSSVGEKYPLYLIYDPGPQPGILQQEESGVKVTIRNTDGRAYFPIRSAHFKKRDLKSKCIKDSKENPNIYDVQVCDYVPEGSHWSYKFEPDYIYDQSIDDPNVKEVKYTNYYHQTSTLGVVTQTGILIQLLRPNETDLILLYLSYPSFTYFETRIANRCQALPNFDGCSKKALSANKHIRGRKIRIRSAILQNPILCVGTKIVLIRWFIQRDVGFEGKYDPVPEEYLDFENQKFLIFPPAYFTDGRHMLELEVTMQGDPPHYGGSSIQRVKGRCWIQVELGMMNVQAIGGVAGTASCFHRLSLDFESLNPSMKISEMDFVIRCDHPEDPECEERKTEVPGIRKFYTPCNTLYNYNVTARHFISKPVFHNFSLKIILQKLDASIYISCKFNCYPIDTTKRLVAFGITTPYIPGKMTWATPLINDMPMKGHVEEDVEAFAPLETTRCMRIDGMELISGTQVATVTLSASMGPLGATSKFKVVDLNMILGYYAFRVRPDGGIFSYSPARYEIHYPPLIHILLEINFDIGESIVLITFDRVPEDGIFQARTTWRIVTMCLRNSELIQGCGPLKYVWPSRSHPMPPITMNDLSWYFAVGNVRDFLNDAVHWFHQGLVPHDKPTPFDQPGRATLTWSRSLRERHLVVSYMTQIHEFLMPELHAMLSSLTMVFLSPEGNALEELVPFHENFQGLADIRSKGGGTEITEFLFHSWVDMRFSSMILLDRAANIVYNMSRDEPDQTLPRFLPGDVFDCMMKAWNLAHIQGTAIRYMKGHLKWSLHRELMEAELDIKAKKGEVAKLKVIHKIALALPTWTVLFYGIRCVGNNATRMWSVRSTYQGIIQAFDRNNEGEHFKDLGNYIFGPKGPIHDGKGPPGDEVNEWMNSLNLKLPLAKDIPSLQDKELNFIAFTTRNRKADPEIGPLVYFNLINRDGKIYKRLPDGQKYKITIPVMLDGELSNFSRIEMYNDSLLRPSNPDDKLKYYNVYKFTLPSHFDVWDLRIFTDDPISIKVLVNYETLPDIEDTEKQPEQTGVWDMTFERYEVRIKVDTSEAIEGGVDTSGHYGHRGRGRRHSDSSEFDHPVYFYFGIVVTNDTPVETPEAFHIKNNVDVCEVQEPTFTHGKKRCTGIQEGEFKVIDCECEEFGFIFAKADHVSLTKLLISPVETSFPVGLTTIQFVVPLVVGLIIILLVAGFIVADWLRTRQAGLILIEDAYVKDSHPLVIGVYTGKNLLAGTRANVAIKVIGLSSSSRVHLLRTKKRRTLRSYHDDWFYIVTHEPLGKITSIILWHDHACLSEWYCDYILIFDVKQELWYLANVCKWFRIDSDVETSRARHIKTFRFTNLDVGLKAMPHRFRDAFISETRNLHHVFSIFGLHLRSLQTYEQRYTILLLKFLSMCIVTWVTQEYHDFTHTITEPDISIHVDQEVVWDIILIAVIPYFFTTPYYLLVRSTQMSGLVQKKTTHPVNLEVIKMGIKAAASKEAKETAASGGSDKKPVDTGIKTDSKGTRSVLFQMDSVDRTQSDQSWLATTKPEDMETTATHKNKKHWSATHYRVPFWRKLLVLLCGPSQFRCVNVSYDIFEVKMGLRMKIARIMAVTVVALGFITVVWAENTTTLWRRTYLGVFVLGMALLIDILILNPIIIMASTMISHIFLKTTGRETAFWCDTIKLPSVKKLNFYKYCVTATDKLHKPLLSVEIEALQAKKKKIKAYKTCALNAYVLLCVVIVTKLLMIRFDVGYYYSVRAIFATADAGPTYQVRQSYGINQVITPYMVSKYLPSTFGDLPFLWPGGKHMSPDNGRWFLDLTSKPIGPVNVVVTFVSEEKTLNVAMVFRPFYKSAVGWLSESEVYKENFTLAGTYLRYEKIANYYVYGKTGDAYIMAGHTTHMPMTDWKAFYTKLGSLVEELVAERNSSRQPRVMILTYNLVNSFTNRILTVDVVVEFLPAGVCSVKLEVNSEKSRGRRFIEVLFLRLTFIAMVSILAIVNLTEISKQGFREYVSQWNGVLKLLMLVLVTIITINTFALFLAKYERFALLFNYPTDMYLDLHDVVTWEMADSIILAICLLIMCADLAVVIRDAAGIQLLSQASSAGFRVTSAILLSILIYSRAAGSSVGLYDRKRWFLWINVVLKTVFPIPLDELEMTPLFLVFAIFILVVWSKVFTALYIFQFEYHDEEYLNKDYVGDPNKQQAVSILKYRTVKKYSIEASMAQHELLFNLSLSRSPFETALAERKRSSISIRSRLASMRARESEPFKRKSTVEEPQRDKVQSRLSRIGKYLTFGVDEPRTSRVRSPEDKQHENPKDEQKD